MSSVAWSTAAVLMLLTPGLLALLGLYLPARVSRDVVPQTGLSQLAYLILISAFIHAPAILIIRTAANLGLSQHIDLGQLFAVLDLGLAKAASAPDLGREIYDNLGHISLYFFITGVLGLLVGYSVGRLIVAGPLRSLALHGWVYDLQSQRAACITFAYVLTNVRHEERTLMYKGILDELHIGDEGTISYLTIIESSRYYLVLDDDAPRTTVSSFHQLVSTAERPREFARQFLVIEGEDIANVVFESYEINPDSIARLEAAVTAAAAEERAKPKDLDVPAPSGPS